MAEGPLRIVRRGRAYGAGDATVEDYWKRLAAMAPAEVTGFYLTFHAFLISGRTPEQLSSDGLVSWWPWICFLLAILVRWWATRDGEDWRTGQPIPTAVAALAFVLWVLALGHNIAFISDLPIFADDRVPAILAAVATFVVPIFYKGDPPSRRGPSLDNGGQA